MLINKDCLEALKEIETDSIEALVTDPPAGIAFMNKDWDKDKGGRDSWIAWMTEVMQECLRVLKPGAHGFVWALPRTSHWTATALEDAGFEIRDICTHLFGSGFPKSHNISRAIDKKMGAKREVVGPNRFIHRNGKENKTCYGKASRPDETKNMTDQAKQWDGWGTALKPACEFWYLVQKKELTVVPLSDIEELNNLIGVLLCQMLNVKYVEKYSMQNQKDLDVEMLDFVQWIVEDNLLKLNEEQLLKTDIFRSQEMGKTFLSIVLLWNNILKENLRKVNTSTTLTETSKTTELKTLRLMVLESIFLNIIHQNDNMINGVQSFVKTALRISKDKNLKLKNIQKLFVQENVFLPIANQLLQLLVKFVENLLKKHTQELSIVQESVPHKHQEQKQQSVKSVFVNIVVKHLKQLFPEIQSTVTEDVWQKLIPNSEHWVLVRKPFKGTVVNNVLEHGTGGINIDESRVETNGEVRKRNDSQKQQSDIKFNASEKVVNVSDKWNQGRFPANLILSHHPECKEVCSEDCPIKMLDDQSGILKSGDKKCIGRERTPGNTGFGGVETKEFLGDKGGASRFFFCCAKDQNDVKQNLCDNVNIVKKNSNQPNQVEDFVLRLAAIEDSLEGNQLKNIITPFMTEIRKLLKINSEINTKMILPIGQKCLLELKHMIMEKLKNNHVKCVELQTQINTMMIIQNLLNIDGFVDLVISNTILKNMVLGEKALRFKYCAKASKSERNKGLEDVNKQEMPSGGHLDWGVHGQTGKPNKPTEPQQNHHPTVKPQKLMQYLIKMITPEGGTVLDPFMGSGSTGIAALDLGFNFIGIEQNKDYYEIARNRMK